MHPHITPTAPIIAGVPTTPTPHGTLRDRFTRPLVLLQLLVLGLTLLAGTAAPARADIVAPTDEPTDTATYFTNELEQAIALAESSVVFIGIEATGWVHDGTGWLNDSYPYVLDMQCTGTIIDPAGYILTAAHCVDATDYRYDFILEGVLEWVVNGWHLDENGNEIISIEQLFDAAYFDWTVEGTDPGSPVDLVVDVHLSETAAGMAGTSVARARVLDLLPFDQGDVALLKIEATGLPAMPLADDMPNVGAEIVAAGFPVSVDGVTDPNLHAAYKDGRVSQHRTHGTGSVPVLEVSSAMSGGMSGGPTFNLSGEVVGVNSYGIVGESAAFNFVSPVQLVHELVSRNGLTPELGTVSERYREGIFALVAGDGHRAEEAFDAVLEQAPNHRRAQELRAAARELSGSRLGDGLLVTLLLLAGPSAGIGILAAVVARRARRRREDTTSAPVVSPPPVPVVAAGTLPAPGSSNA